MPQVKTLLRAERALMCLTKVANLGLRSLSLCPFSKRRANSVSMSHLPSTSGCNHSPL